MVQKFQIAHGLVRAEPGHLEEEGLTEVLRSGVILHVLKRRWHSLDSQSEI